jgi:hypothetical protein
MLRCLKIMVLLSRMSAEIVIMVRCNHAGDEERRSNVLVFVGGRMTSSSSCLN